MLARAPFITSVLSYILGIIAGQYLHLSDSNLIVWVGLLTLAIISPVIFFGYKNGIRWIVGLGMTLCFWLGGVMCMTLQNHFFDDEVAYVTDHSYDGYMASVTSLPEKRQKSYRFKVETEGFWKNKLLQKHKTNVLVNIPRDAEFIPAVGDVVLVKCKLLDTPTAALNSFDFDYRAYLGYKGIGFTDYWNNGDILLHVGKARNLLFYPLELSELIDEKLRINLPNDKSYGLVKAMLLGRRDDLQADQINDYVVSGTVHILSVSGLHVSILFFVFGFLLRWIKKLRGGVYIYLLVMSLLLSFYAVLTGLPASVVRATVMFIFFLIADVFNRKYSAINILALSALCILMIDPRQLYDLGFQLSYSAMLGIFLLYEPLAGSYSPKHKLGKYIWQVTVLSFAAQLGTFPISIYYFYQFPTYFWLVNPVVIFLTTVLIQSTLVMLVFSFFNLGVLQTVVNYFTEFVADAANWFVSIPKYLPNFLIESLWLDKLEAVGYVVILLLVWLAYWHRATVYLKYSFMVILFVSIYGISKSVQAYYTDMGYIHSVRNHQVVSFKSGNNLLVLADAGLQSSDLPRLLNGYMVGVGGLDIYRIVNNGDGTNFRKIRNGILVFWKGKYIFLGDMLKVETAVDYLLPQPDYFQKYSKNKYVYSPKPGSSDGWVPVHDLSEGGLAF